MSVLRYILNERRRGRSVCRPTLSDRHIGLPLRMAPFILIPLSLLLLASCSKEKIDFTYDNSPIDWEASNVRIVNIGDYYTQVEANGEPITNFNSRGTGTDHFPYNGQLTHVWDIPTDLFNERTQLDLSLYGAASSVSFSMTQTNRAVDYYALRPEGSGQPYVVPVERDITPPSKPDHFKIRVINLCKTVPPLDVTAINGLPKENLVGSYTLTYADGTPVSPETSNVGIGQRVSSYIELPYGTYQFKVLAADGRQLSATNKEGTYRDYDPASSRIVSESGTSTTRLTYAPAKTYEPGGVYTLVVAPMLFWYFTSGLPGKVLTLQNAFEIIADVEEPLNETYARVQAFNAVPGNTSSIRLNESTLGSVAFGGHTEYQVRSSGDYTIQAVSGAGNVTASLDYPLQAGRNYTIWLVPTDSVPQLLCVPNDLSGTPYRGYADDDGTFNRYYYDMAFAFRFLNLCPDVPYLSFTANNGQSVSSGLLAGGVFEKYQEEAMYNLRPGQVATATFPYVWFDYRQNVYYHFMAYASGPNLTPGTWLDKVSPLSSWDLVSREALYTDADRAVPPYETGIYSVALIGRTGDNVPEDQKARIIYVKHIK